MNKDVANLILAENLAILSLSSQLRVNGLSFGLYYGSFYTVLASMMTALLVALLALIQVVFMHKFMESNRISKKQFTL